MTTIEAQMWGSFWVLMLAACYFVRAERVLRAARAEREALAAEQTRIEAARGALARQQASIIESEARITGMIVEAEAEHARIEALRRGVIEGLGCWELGMREEAFEALAAAGVKVKA